LTESDASPPTPDPPPIETLPTPGEGPPLPTSGASYATTSAGLEQRLSQRWQLALDGSYSLYRYDEQLLQESEQVYGSVQLGRQVGRRGQIYLAYGYSSSWFDAGRQRAHQMLVGGRKQATRGVGFELAGGVGYLESTGSFYPSGRAGLTVSGRRTRLAFLYYRDFGQAYGYGRQTVGDIFSVGLSWTPARRWSFSAGYNFGYRSDPSDETYSITYSSASAGLSWNIGAGFDVAARYSWDRNETEGLPPVEGGRAMASLSWDVDWR
jgi:hypothetical protein